ncbi:SDR family NAD(P)-dependent oxidoreductase [Phenylobacterium sp. LjRoot225]|uniref:SDR family oxidoreductase n=1 Tax=Phenylobacterium sp. LjRoot225 TaxID=3342285 RepID=UPI003ECD10AD
MTDIAGKTALVTGGGSGIGRGLALALAAERASVVVADILLDKAQAVAEEIRSQGGSAIALACDVCERDSIKQMKADANAAYGPVSLLFANAGATSFERLTDMSEADVDWIIQVNLMGVTYCLQTFLPDMIAAREGHVMATASMAGMLPAWIPMHAPYSGAKMGIIGLMLNLSLELAEHNIGSTVYCPGGVATGMKDNNERYRPQRFGGPGPGPVKVPEGFFMEAKTTFLPPEQIAPMVLRGVRNNRAIVFDHSDQRKIFQETYLNLVMQAFDDALDYEQSMGMTP